MLHGGIHAILFDRIIININIIHIFAFSVMLVCLISFALQVYDGAEAHSTSSTEAPDPRPSRAGPDPSPRQDRRHHSSDEDQQGQRAGEGHADDGAGLRLLSRTGAVSRCGRG